MTTDLIEIPPAARALGRTGAGGYEQRLNQRDMPVAFTLAIETRALPNTVRVEMKYPASNDEPLDATELDKATVWLGRHSRRLFRLEMRFQTPIPNPEAFARAFIDSTAKAFAKMAHSEEPVGARLNHNVARAALLDDLKAPPAWLIAAMRRAF